MKNIEDFAWAKPQPSFRIWLMSGALIGLGVVVPGMSPSNFLIYLGLYDLMAAGISKLDLGVIIPLILGGIACVLLFARLVSWLFKKFYAVMYHTILGIVIWFHAGDYPLCDQGLDDRGVHRALPGRRSDLLPSGQIGREVSPRIVSWGVSQVQAKKCATLADIMEVLMKRSVFKEFGCISWASFIGGLLLFLTGILS